MLDSEFQFQNAVSWVAPFVDFKTQLAGWPPSSLPSGKITRDAYDAYSAMTETIAGYTFAELLAQLRDIGDWAVSPSGLWTKKIQGNVKPMAQSGGSAAS